MRPSTPRSRRFVAPLAALAAAIILSGCAGESEPSFTERGYPTAPAQELPEAASTDADVPLVELVDADWLATTAERTNIDPRVVAAYAGASIRVAQTTPGCGIGWNTLAGIGRVESHHGTIYGSEVAENGSIDPPIIGIPLDGTNGTLAVPDTEGGTIDTDTEWDRAVGPMQFIPSTWAQFGQDANLDGTADPNQLDDAVLTAAVYLCDRSGELVSDNGWNTAVSAYNLPVEYARDVAAYARMYAE
ncbi:lytic transglycosylase domain-containing protein [Gulosibacter massiliensis]|uniref:lytic transglycosylase domain-containing protein n=1 Tax=Gulosibacter massiliensis TaxID=2479839 RepID=UPI000F63CABA|nr:lytic murein transglycosylase [Gulosibacter massiliensis]